MFGRTTLAIISLPEAESLDCIARDFDGMLSHFDTGLAIFELSSESQSSSSFFTSNSCRNACDVTSSLAIRSLCVWNSRIPCRCLNLNHKTPCIKYLFDQ